MDVKEDITYLNYECYAVVGKRDEWTPVQTRVYTVDGDEAFVLSGEVRDAALLNSILWIQDKAFKRGMAAGERDIQHKLRILLGAAPAPVPGRDD